MLDSSGASRGRQATVARGGEAGPDRAGPREGVGDPGERILLVRGLSRPAILASYQEVAQAALNALPAGRGGAARLMPRGGAVWIRRSAAGKEDLVAGVVAEPEQDDGTTQECTLAAVATALAPWAAREAAGVPVVEEITNGERPGQRLMLLYDRQVAPAESEQASAWISAVRQQLRPCGVRAVWLFANSKGGQRVEIELSDNELRDRLLRRGLGESPALVAALSGLNLLGSALVGPKLVCAPATPAQRRRLHSPAPTDHDVRPRPSVPTESRHAQSLLLRRFAWRGSCGVTLAPPPSDLADLARSCLGASQKDRVVSAVAISPGLAVAFLQPFPPSTQVRNPDRRPVPVRMAATQTEVVTLVPPPPAPGPLVVIESARAVRAPSDVANAPSVTINGVKSATGKSKQGAPAQRLTQSKISFSAAGATDAPRPAYGTDADTRHQLAQLLVSHDRLAAQLESVVALLHDRTRLHTSPADDSTPAGDDMVIDPSDTVPAEEPDTNGLPRPTPADPLTGLKSEVSVSSAAQALVDALERHLKAGRIELKGPAIATVRTSIVPAFLRMLVDREDKRRSDMRASRQSLITSSAGSTQDHPGVPGSGPPGRPPDPGIERSTGGQRRFGLFAASLRQASTPRPSNSQASLEPAPPPRDLPDNRHHPPGPTARPGGRPAK